MNQIRIALLIAAVSVFPYAACRTGQVFSEDEFAARQVTIGDTTYGYRVYVPQDRPAGGKLPVMLYLHGSNRRGQDNQAQLRDLAGVIKANPQNFPYIIVFPQCRFGTSWNGPMMEQSMAALEQTVSEFGGDASRLSLGGFSMGGFSVWNIAITYTEKFAALVSVAAGVEPLGTIGEADRILLSPQATAAAGAPDPYKAYAVVLGKVPVWIVHGGNDKSVPVDGARKFVAALKEAGGTDVNYLELEGVGHGSVAQAFNDPNLAQWLIRQRTGSPK